MRLMELFTGNKQIENGKMQQSQTAGNVFNRQLQLWKPGQTLQGEVIAKNGTEIQLRLTDDVVIKARVDQNINLELGKMMTFEVKNNGQLMTLMALYTNTAADANVLKALDMASLPVNPETIAMTEQMMKAGISIDKSTLQQFYRECNMHPQSPVSDIVDLHKLALPVKEENLAQIASYKNLTHQLVNGLNEVSNALFDTIQGMMQSEHTEEAARLLQTVIKLFSEEPETADGTAVKNLLSEAIPQEQLPAEGSLPERLWADSVAPETVSSEEVLSKSMEPESVLQEGLLPENGQMGKDEEKIVITEEGAVQQKGQENASGNGELPTGREGLQRLLQQGIADKDMGLLQNLLKHKEVKVFLKEILQKACTLSPSDVAEGEKVKELYQRMGNQMKDLVRVLANSGQTNSEAYRAASNLTQNLDFLQQINQNYTYIQLPLRLQQGNNAHGDLYVYSSKKHLAAKDGKLTALLHLDMEHLGPLDVYVAMQYEQVSTKFYLSDETMLDFLSEHMDLLTERLKKRGYHCSCEMLAREKQAGDENTETVVQRLLEQEPHIPIVQYAFDVRT